MDILILMDSMLTIFLWLLMPDKINSSHINAIKLSLLITDIHNINTYINTDKNYIK